MRALACALVLAGTPAFAQRAPSDRWALGVTIGDPFGVSLKRYNGPRRGPPGGNNTAWDAYAAFAYGPGVRFGGDWLWNLARLATEPEFAVDAYAGVGPFVGAFSGPCGPGFIDNRCNGDVYFGARVPLGVEMLLRKAPITFGLELAPGVGFAPGRAGMLLDFLLAVRWLL
jgi:hypothetical protein